MRKILFVLAIVYFAIVSASGQGDITISWLTSETFTESFGSGQATTVNAFMEFYEEDILNFNSQSKQIDSIKEILFHITPDYISTVSSCKVIIMQGNDISSAAEMASQIVPIDELLANWNTVILENPYGVDSSLRLYIGYQVTTTEKAYPISLSEGGNIKQSWSIAESKGSNVITDLGYNLTFLIKATAATKTSPENLLVLNSIDIKNYILLGDSLQVKGEIQNFGSNEINSFKASYEVNGQIVDIEEFTGLNINKNAKYSFSIPRYYVPTTAQGAQVFKVIISEPNGVVDTIKSYTQQTAKLKVYNELVDRIILHEGFTSSTCGPCVQGNVVLKSILNAKDYDKWACVKYQMNWPGVGDPYYTNESGIRRDLYSVSGVPYLIVDGVGYADDTRAYKSNFFDNLASVSAEAKMTGISTINNATITLDATIVPVSDFFTDTNLRFFAAIVEKRTTKNAKTNGEKEFLYVFKKFMTDANGDKLSGLALGAQKQVNYTYTFKGNYRLPANANSPINHNTEHSVEIFDNLMVVYWLQNMKTKEVYQAGKAAAYDGIIVALKDVNTQEIAVSVFPNPASEQLNIQSNVLFSRISIVNMLGQTVREIEVGKENYVMYVGDMAKGLYLLKIETPQGITTKKIQIK